MTENAWEYRHDAGTHFEDDLITDLRQNGLRVHQFGTEHTFTPGAVRAVIRARFPALRYLPDLLVTNRHGTTLLAIEAKGHKVPPGVDHHHACNVAHFDELTRFEQWSRVPVLFVFGDWRCIFRAEMQAQARLQTASGLMETSRRNNGTGTPFYDVHCRACAPLSATLQRIFP